MSICCSFASTVLVFTFLDYLHKVRNPNPTVSHWQAFCLAAAALAIGLIFTHLWNRVARGAMAGVMAAGAVGTLVFMAVTALAYRFSAFILFLLIGVGGFASDVAFVAVTRRMLRWAGGMTRSLRVAGVVVLSLLIAVILVGPMFLPPGFLRSRGIPFLPFVVILTESLTNVFDGLLALLFVFLALILLVHRLIWPLLTRTLFRMQDIGTKGRRAILAAIGVVLLGGAVFGGKFPDLLKELIKAGVG
jgi:hypothetical protein